jgi:hypothetical protein
MLPRKPFVAAPKMKSECIKKGAVDEPHLWEICMLILYQLFQSDFESRRANVVFCST